MKYKGTLVVVNDCKRALKFYSDMCGFKLIQDNDGNMELTDNLYLQESVYWGKFIGKKHLGLFHEAKIDMECGWMRAKVERPPLFLRKNQLVTLTQILSSFVFDFKGMP